METHVLILVAVGILGFGLFSRRAETSILTPPIFFTALGALAAGVGFAHLEPQEGLVHTLAEITLVMVLFTDASRIRFDLLRREHDLPVRLLLVGLPLTILLGTLAAAGLFPGFTLWQAALLAAVLAPTDAALGQAVVSSPKVPVRIRQTLNVESGLNDGIALPLVLVFLSACSSAVPGQGGTEYWLRFAALQVTLGPLVGWLVGWLGSRAVARAAERGFMNETFQYLSALGLALLAYAGAEVVHGNGFIAAFVAGLVIGHACADDIKEKLHEFGEAEGQLLTLLVFVVFGAALLPEALSDGLFGAGAWRIWLYAVLSLTVLRMVPVALAFLGAGLQPATVLFVGWFGPRGIASVLFGLLVVDRSVLAASDEIFVVVIATVLLSILLHGVTANPLANAYARVLAARNSGDEGRSAMPEGRAVSEMPVRIRHDRAGRT